MQFKARVIYALLFVAFACTNPTIPASQVAVEEITAVSPTASPDEIVEQLLEGNLAFARNRRNHLPDIGPARRAQLVAGQSPKAIVLSCSDSRVPPEHVFQQGLGDLFVSRIAGNVPLEGEVASVEYAVEHLKVPVLLILGHSKCGAVTAAVQQSQAATELTPSLTALVNEIMPAVTEAEASLPAGGDLIDASIHANARLAASHLLERSAVIREAEEAGRLKVVVGIYDLASGLVGLETPVAESSESAHSH